MTVIFRIQGFREKLQPAPHPRNSAKKLPLHQTIHLTKGEVHNSLQAAVSLA